jgi:hypothetical protein
MVGISKKQEEIKDNSWLEIIKFFIIL